MGQPYVVVDAFTEEPFAGNPAAVIVLAEPADEAWMRAVAREMNLSETAFLHPEGDGFRLRWLTPRVEVPLCGHATLASAHVLFETGALGPDEPARFETLSGTLWARREGEAIALDLPARIATACEPPPGLLEALGVGARWVGRVAQDYLVHVESEPIVLALAPDPSALRALAVRGVIVTARADGPAFDIVSRFFAPGAGIDEDPVTGAAHCVLAPYWTERLGSGELRAYQASARGGALRVELRGERVRLAGHAVTVARGELLAPGARSL